MVIITSQFVPPGARENMARESRKNAIDSAIRALSSVEDPSLQQIIAQLRAMYNG